MPIHKETLYQALADVFENSNIECIDLAGDDDHWQVIITSPVFAGKTRIQQHKMVQEAVKHFDIHALAIKTNAS